jgi:hypothetical protein
MRTTSRYPALLNRGSVEAGEYVTYSRLTFLMTFCSFVWYQRNDTSVLGGAYLHYVGDRHQHHSC